MVIDAWYFVVNLNDLMFMTMRNKQSAEFVMNKPYPSVFLTKHFLFLIFTVRFY